MAGVGVKILSIECINFCSYPRLEMNFENMGLALIHGKTGAGKSTILDAVCWALYGVTAKGTTADGVRPLNENTQPTSVSVFVKLRSGNEISIHRIRGKGVNDLWWTSVFGEQQRGKDLTETQELINQVLGADVDTFIAGCYFHEFSPTGAFFTAKAKERRELLEQLAPLELPNKLAESMSRLVKATKDKISKKELEKERHIGKEEQLQDALKSNVRSISNWEKEKARSLIELQRLYDNFDNTKRENIETTSLILSDLEDKIKEQGAILDKANECTKSVCEACGQTLKGAKWNATSEAVKYQQLTSTHERALDNLESYEAEENHYAAQIKKEKARINPFHEEGDKKTAALEQLQITRVEINKTLKSLYALYADYKTLYDLSGLLRGELLKKSVRDIQDTTNSYLERYFDAELRISLLIEGDIIEATVLKNGYECAYKQLSKGQRGLLKLCFSVTVQEAVSNNKGIHFDNLFYDESLDGLDDDLKNRSYNLFSRLSENHESVLVIEHNESFKNKFDKSFLVTMEGEKSCIILE